MLYRDHATRVGLSLDGEYPVQVPYFMSEIIEEITLQARKSKYIDQASGFLPAFHCQIIAP